MTVSFYGKTPDGSSIILDFEHPAYLQLSNGNAHAFLSAGTTRGERKTSISELAVASWSRAHVIRVLRRTR